MKYFAYGSNMLTLRMKSRVLSAESIGMGRLAGHSLRFHMKSLKDGSAKCDAYVAGNVEDEMFGALWEIDPREKPLLDKAESLGVRYAERKVNIESGGETIVCFTYVALPEAVHSDMFPFGWYKDLVLTGAIEHGLPSAYISAIANVPHTDDPDKEREMHFMEMIRSGNHDCV